MLVYKTCSDGDLLLLHKVCCSSLIVWIWQQEHASGTINMQSERNTALVIVSTASTRDGSALQRMALRLSFIGYQKPTPKTAHCSPSNEANFHLFRALPAPLQEASGRKLNPSNNPSLLSSKVMGWRVCTCCFAITAAPPMRPARVDDVNWIVCVCLFLFMILPPRATGCVEL